MLEKNRGKRRPARQNAKGDSTWHHESGASLGASDKTAERSGKTWGSIFAAGIISAIVLSLGHFIGGGGARREVRTAAGGALWFRTCGTAQEQRVAVISGFVIGKILNGDVVLPDLLESESGQRVPFSTWYDVGSLRKDLRGWVRFSNRKEGTEPSPKDRISERKLPRPEASRIAALSNISTHTVLSVTAHNERRQFNFWKRLRKTLEHEKITGVFVDCTLNALNFRSERQLIDLAWKIDDALTAAGRTVGGRKFSVGGRAALRTPLCWKGEGGEDPSPWGWCDIDFP